MAPPKAFDFTGEVALVTGAGSRMDGERLARPFFAPLRDDWLNCFNVTSDKTQGKLGTAGRLLFSSLVKEPRWP
jgi:hypothetical protein